LEAGDLLFSGTGTVGRIAVIEDTPKNWNIKEGVYAIKPNLEKIHSGYLSHLLNSREIVTNYSKKIVGAPVISLPMSDLRRLKLPIPCPDNPKKSLEIQAEIVCILDSFTELTTQLTTELTTRKKQYNHYRDQLLSFEDGQVEWKTLGDIGEILRGTALTEKQAKPGEVPVVANGPSYNYFHDQSNRSGETIVIARSGAYAGLVSYWNQSIFLTDAFSIHPDKNVLSAKFLYHFFKKDQTKIHLMGKGAGVPHVRANDFASYKIPVPPMEEQARIVAILDKFDALTNSLTEGLPREIDLRQKQYAHYRDLLLSFPKPQEVVA
jgi:type I restriction enzyme S subunit